MSDFVFTLNPLRPSAVPSEDALIKAAQQLIESTLTWKQGKTYFKTVKTCDLAKGPTDGIPWHCRISEHRGEEASFDLLWSKLGIDKSVNEKEFIPEIQKVTKIKGISPTMSIWSMYYTFPPPLSPRVFTALQLVHLNDEPPRSGLIVSIPIDLTSPEDADLAKLEESGVRGRYVGVERILELENGNTEWRMATSGVAGGNIPQFVSELTMNKKIAEDVPHFLNWLHSLQK